MSAWPGRIFTFYRTTTIDWPGKVVVRPYDYMVPGAGPSPIACVLDPKEVHMQRMLLNSRGCICLGRDQSDDPVIMESWI
jgi:hypothetical protein